MSVTRIRNSQELSAELAKLKGLTDAKGVAPPLTGPQLGANIGELSLALESTTLAPEMRKQIEAARADLIRQQFILVHGHLFDENGEKPVDEKAIVETVTKNVIESLAAAPESESCGSLTHDDIDEQAEAENPATIPTPRVTLQMPQAVVLSSENVVVLKAALRAHLMHTVVKVLSLALGE